MNLHRTFDTERINLVVLDLDGTTIEDDGISLESAVTAARSAGLRVSEADLEPRMGPPKREVFEELAVRQLGPTAAATAVRDAAYALYRRLVEETFWREGARPVDGVEETFAWLVERRVKIAIGSSFHRAVTDTVLDALGWRTITDAVVSVDEVAAPRPAPFMIHTAMARCLVDHVASVLVAGDGCSDVVAGVRSGARAVVGVTSGTTSARELFAGGAHAVIARITELPALIESLDREHLRLAI